MKTSIKMLLAASALLTTGFAATVPASAQPTAFSFRLGDVAVGYNDGYYDRERNWHAWRDAREHRWYRTHNVRNYRAMRREAERDNRYRGMWGDRDRDGIPNAVDRDRDNDGVPNYRDRRPNNPYR